jgi:hypothetical protein
MDATPETPDAEMIRAVFELAAQKYDEALCAAKEDPFANAMVQCIGHDILRWRAVESKRDIASDMAFRKSKGDSEPERLDEDDASAIIGLG